MYTSIVGFSVVPVSDRDELRVGPPVLGQNCLRWFISPVGDCNSNLGTTIEDVHIRRCASFSFVRGQ